MNTLARIAITAVLTMSITVTYSDNAPCEDQTYSYSNGVLTPAPRTTDLPVCA